MIGESIAGINDLTTEEKLLLSNELWAEVQAKMDPQTTDPQLVQELRQRLEEYEKDPSAVVSWEEVKQKFRRKNAES